MKQTPLSILRDTLSLMNVRTFIPAQVHNHPENLKLPFPMDPELLSLLLNDIFSFISNNITPDTLLHTQDLYGFSNLLLYVPEESRDNPDDFCLIIGPFLEHNFEHNEILQILQNNHLPVHLLDSLKYTYKYTPVINDITTFEYVIRELASALFKTNYVLKNISRHSDFLKGYSIHHFEALDINNQMHHNSDYVYILEKEFSLAVANGDYDSAREIYQSYYKLNQPKDILNSPTKQIFFLTTIYMLCRKAMESKGVPSIYIDNISNTVEQLITGTQRKKDFNLSACQIIHRYCNFMKHHSMNGYSPSIQDIVTYIDFHFEEDLNLDFFSKKFGLTKSYLSSLFKKETGIGLIEYIHQIRMQKAMTLLNLTSAPITEIAVSCGYNDISYFIRVFKRIYGMTPKAYQKSILKNFQE